MCEIVTKTCKVCGETKDESLFDKKRLKCRKCRSKSCFSNGFINLPDWYVRKTIALSYKRKNVPIVISPDEINKKRTELLEARKCIEENLALKENNQRRCTECKKIRDLKHFYKNKQRCNRCRNNSERAIINKKSYKQLLPDSLVRCYIKGSFRRRKSLKIDNKDISQEFIELKRKELILKRKIESHGKEKAPN
jgi:hypothetical protein